MTYLHALHRHGSHTISHQRTPTLKAAVLPTLASPHTRAHAAGPAEAGSDDDFQAPRPSQASPPAAQAAAHEAGPPAAAAAVAEAAGKSQPDKVPLEVQKTIFQYLNSKLQVGNLRIASGARLPHPGSLQAVYAEPCCCACCVCMVRCKLAQGGLNCQPAGCCCVLEHTNPWGTFKPPLMCPRRAARS